MPYLLPELTTQGLQLGPGHMRTQRSTLESTVAAGVVSAVGLVQPLPCQVSLARVWGCLFCWAIGYDTLLSVGCYAPLHGP